MNKGMLLAATAATLLLSFDQAALAATPKENIVVADSTSSNACGNACSGQVANTENSNDTTTVDTNAGSDY